MKNFFIVLGLLIFSLPFNAEATRLDIYREMLRENSYTIEYENITPAPRVTNKDAVPLYGKNGLSVEENDLLVNKPKNGIITADGQNKYEEIGGEVDDRPFYLCRLSKDGEDFFFTKYKKTNKDSEKWKYVGTRRNRVKANGKNYLAEVLENESYGDVDMSRLINAILSIDDKNNQKIKYKLVAQGKLPNKEIFYEDYCGNIEINGETVSEIIRYYFEGNELVKISSASFYLNSDGKAEGRRCIIRVKFSNVPKTELLQLPKGVKDETKRQKKSKEA